MLDNYLNTPIKIWQKGKGNPPRPECKSRGEGRLPGLHGSHPCIKEGGDRAWAKKEGVLPEAHTNPVPPKGNPLSACLSSSPREQSLRQSLHCNTILGCAIQRNKVKGKGK